MNRKFLHLFLCMLEVLRIIALALICFRLGLFGPAAENYVFRYVLIVQLIFPVLLFFIWLDFEKYFFFKPLTLALKACSILALLPLGINALLSISGGGIFGNEGVALFLPVLAILIVDSSTALGLLTTKVEVDRTKGDQLTMNTHSQGTDNE